MKLFLQIFDGMCEEKKIMIELHQPSYFSFLILSQCVLFDLQSPSLLCFLAQWLLY